MTSICLLAPIRSLCCPFCLCKCAYPIAHIYLPMEWSMDPIVCGNSLPYVINSEQSIGRGIFTNKDRCQQSKGSSAPDAQDPL